MQNPCRDVPEPAASALASGTSLHYLGFLWHFLDEFHEVGKNNPINENKNNNQKTTRKLTR